MFFARDSEMPGLEVPEVAMSLPGVAALDGDVFAPRWPAQAPSSSKMAAVVIARLSMAWSSSQYWLLPAATITATLSSAGPVGLTPRGRWRENARLRHAGDGHGLARRPDRVDPTGDPS